MRLTAVFVLVVCGVGSHCLADSSLPARQPGPFDGGWEDAITAVLAFLVLLGLLRFLAWKPLLNSLRARQDYIAKQLSDAETTSKKSEKVLADYHQKLEGYKEDGQKIISDHLKQAQTEAEKVLAEAKDKAEQVRHKADADIARSRRQAEEELMAQAGDIVLRLGEELLTRTLTDDDNQKLISEAIKKIKQQNADKNSG